MTAFGFNRLVANLVPGTMLASLMGYFEWYVVDRLQAFRLSIPYDAYKAEWQAYIDWLEQKPNPYILDMDMYWRFESRTGIASLVGGVALRLSARIRPTTASRWV